MSLQAAINPLWLVHKSVYSPEAFVAERKDVLRKVWLFVAHESEFPEAGSFVAREIAGDPVLISRGADGRIRAFYNTCRHRGAIVASQEQGTARAFLCPYHNWSYNLDGSLRALPGAEAYEVIGFRKEDFGLAPVRLENFCGLLFVCLDPDAPSIEAFFGEELTGLMRRTLGAARYEVYRKDVFDVKANWKMLSENWRDGYHVPNVHPKLAKGMPPQRYKLTDNGHCIQYITYGRGFVADDVWEATQKHALPGLEPLTGFHFHLFPGLVIQPLNNQLQILSQRPVDARSTIWERRALGVVGDTPEVRETRVKCWTAWSSNQVAEDIVVLELQQRGIMSEGMPFSIMARGEEVTEGIRGDDNRMRQFWNRWRAMMGVARNEWRPHGT
ncbi:MAG TPA: aromatic ring-hydroxylating dioxygenase subunit alpha [Ramlibacter sp.]|uniref:aromatic ring-hydroxylating oxygenase subunit alpha n=1 Tax=Ramlibacter sp. TaxID=1917967 RepID=UPI002C845CE6|nr:aromatic ring-hydroxylating dioxygenase subunit alpha [Ramlibacter sp.]HVZ46510.1 aromatic ring-hydroxylating dioxygenase subunit alpha [Ramlibacter sp.]